VLSIKLYYLYYLLGHFSHVFFSYLPDKICVTDRFFYFFVVFTTFHTSFFSICRTVLKSIFRSGPNPKKIMIWKRVFRLGPNLIENHDLSCISPPFYKIKFEILILRFLQNHSLKYLYIISKSFIVIIKLIICFVCFENVFEHWSDKILLWYSKFVVSTECEYEIFIR
jgi:hypothetical protein